MNTPQLVNLAGDAPVKQAIKEPLRICYLKAKKMFPQWDERHAAYSAVETATSPILAGAVTFLLAPTLREYWTQIHSAEIRGKHFINIRRNGQLICQLSPGDWHTNAASLRALGHILHALAPNQFTHPMQALEWVKSHGWERFDLRREVRR